MTFKRSKISFTSFAVKTIESRLLLVFYSRYRFEIVIKTAFSLSVVSNFVTLNSSVVQSG